MARKVLVAIAAFGLLVGGGVASYRAYRGPVGDSAALGDLAATPVPEFGSLDPSRWRNGAPRSLAESRGEVVFVEGWSPG